MLTLEPVLRSAPPTWSGATWIGQAELAALQADTDVTLAGAQGYHWARILVRDRGIPISFIEAPLVDCLLDRDTLVADGLLDRAAGVDGAPESADASATLPPVTVVVCTHRRPQLLTDALASLLQLDYPDYQIIVVDNAPDNDDTAKVVAGLADPRVRYLCEPRAGLSFARNTGLRAAPHQIVAFTDDDVIVDPRWLRGIALGFTRDSRVAVVTGIVPSSEIRTPAQAYLDQRIRWSRTLRPKLFDLRNPPAGLPLFPFHLGDYGTGANFAVRAAAVLGLGGFDEALGAGVPTEGGEDLDLFLRIILSGKHIALEPQALIWHRHRDTDAAMLAQSRAYGIGLGAVLTKHALRPRSAAVAAQVLLTRAPAVVRHAREFGNVANLAEKETIPVPPEVGRTELRAVVRGPARLLRARRNLARGTGVGR